MGNMIPGAQEDVCDPVDINMPCAQVAVSNCVMIHDAAGNIAVWGRVYED